MAHLFESGFTVREPAWHGLGTVLAEAPKTFDEGREVAGLGWEPLRAPSFGYLGLDADGNYVFDPEHAVMGEYVRDEERSRIIRSDTHALLANTTATRAIINHTDMGEVLDAVVGLDQVTLDTMGSLDGGKKVYTTLHVDAAFQVIGRFAKDSSFTMPFITATNSHDVGALRLGWNTFRVLCANTFQAAESAQEQRGGGYFSFNHTVNWKEQVAQAQQALAELTAFTGEYVKEMNDLADLHVDTRQIETYLHAFTSAAEFGTTARAENNAAKARQAIRDILAGPTCQDINESAYGLVQATTEYLDHVRGTRRVNGSTAKQSIIKRQIINPNPAKKLVVGLAREVALAA